MEIDPNTSGSTKMMKLTAKEHRSSLMDQNKKENGKTEINMVKEHTVT